jgi:hypothetical protein
MTADCAERSRNIEEASTRHTPRALATQNSVVPQSSAYPTGETGPGDGFVPGEGGVGTSMSGPGVGDSGGGWIGWPGWLGCAGVCGGVSGTDGSCCISLISLCDPNAGRRCGLLVRPSLLYAAPS